MSRYGGPWWSFLRPQSRTPPASAEAALEVHLAVLQRKIAESGWTLEEVCIETGWEQTYLLEVLNCLRPLKLDELFLLLETIDVPLELYFEEVCDELEEHGASST